MASVKLLWFHLMPYTNLPEDFAQQHPSVWVDIDPALFDSRLGLRRAHALFLGHALRLAGLEF